MNNAANDQISLRLGPPLPPPAFASIERTLHLAFNKWDTQVGDESVLSTQPVMISERSWTTLQRIAEQLSAELLLHESQILQDDRVQEYIGIPRGLRQLLMEIRRYEVPTPRIMRFDFHPTAIGWRVSEVNADVPGGWREATSLPDLFTEWYPGFRAPDSPLDAWCDAVCNVVGNGHVALLSAPGFLEDLQVIYTFQRELATRGIQSYPIQTPGALDWSSGRCRIRSLGLEVSTIIRFYQIEWLARLNRSCHWHELLISQCPAIVNPTTAVISESKRFPLVLRSAQTWKLFVSESHDPRSVDMDDWDNWVLKASYSNTGDEVHLLADIPARARRDLIRRAQRRPSEWVAQRRFDTISLDSESGPMYPCIGVFVVNGRATGAYARLSRNRVIDGAAREAPVLIEGEDARQ